MVARLASRVILDTQVMVGKPVIRGTRIPVEPMIRMLAQRISEAELTREYPRLERDDIRAALDYAARVLADDSVLPARITS